MPGGVCQTCPEREIKDPFVAQQFQLHQGQRFPQHPDGGQGQNEVADRAATDDKDFGRSHETKSNRLKREGKP
jgi:hypothetical protein